MTAHSKSMLFLRSADDYLGPAAGRFFGSGYRRVGYRVRAATLADGGPAAGPRFTATAGVAYPADWSTKSEGNELRPHLSTLDALILAVRAAEFCARHDHGLDVARRREAWLRQVDIKAGSTALEDGLDAFGLAAERVDTVPLADGTGRVASAYDARVAAMRARVCLVHQPGRPVAAAGDLDEQIGAGYPGLYGTGFTQQRQTVRNVAVDVPGQRADASVVVDPAGADWTGGLESAHGPVVSMIDSFAVALQVGQILLYETDGMTRADSNTLWMRRTSLTAVPIRQRLTPGEPFRVHVRLENSGLLQARDGTWRTATIVGDCLGVRTRCWVTHRLPSGA